MVIVKQVGRDFQVIYRIDDNISFVIVTFHDTGWSARNDVKPIAQRRADDYAKKLNGVSNRIAKLSTRSS